MESFDAPCRCVMLDLLRRHLWMTLHAAPSDVPKPSTTSSKLGEHTSAWPSTSASPMMWWLPLHDMLALTTMFLCSPSTPVRLAPCTCNRLADSHFSVLRESMRSVEWQDRMRVHYKQQVKLQALHAKAQEARLQRSRSAKGRDKGKQLFVSVHELKRTCEEDAAEILRMRKLEQQYLNSALINYMQALTATDDHPWSIVFRLVALWFDNCNAPEVGGCCAASCRFMETTPIELTKMPWRVLRGVLRFVSLAVFWDLAGGCGGGRTPAESASAQVPPAVLPARRPHCSCACVVHGNTGRNVPGFTPRRVAAVRAAVSVPHRGSPAGSHTNHARTSYKPHSGAGGGKSHSRVHDSCCAVRLFGLTCLLLSFADRPAKRRSRHRGGHTAYRRGAWHVEKVGEGVAFAPAMCISPEFSQQHVHRFGRA